MAQSPDLNDRSRRQRLGPQSALAGRVDRPSIAGTHGSTALIPAPRSAGLVDEIPGAPPRAGSLSSGRTLLWATGVVHHNTLWAHDRPLPTRPWTLAGEGEGRGCMLMRHPANVKGHSAFNVLT